MRIAKYRAIRAVIRNIMSAFSEGLQNVRDYSDGLTGEGRRIAEAFNSLSSHSLTMKNQIGSAFAEILTSIMPIVEQIVALITKAANAIAQFFAALGGNSRYYKAVDATAQVAKNLGGGAKSAKEIRNQLMGFDVINRLDKPNESSGGGGGGSTKKGNNMFEYTEIAKGLQKVAAIIRENMPLIEFAVGSSLLGIGAILAFSGANIPLGLGLMAVGAVTLGHAIREDWNNLSPKIQEAVFEITSIVSMALIAIGALLTFSGANIPLGIGLMIAGGIGVASVALAWGKVTAEVQKQVATLMFLMGTMMVALGVIFLFAGFIPLGIGLLLAGGVGLATAAALNWDGILDKLKETWDGIKSWWHSNVAKYVTPDYWQGVIDQVFDLHMPQLPSPHWQWYTRPADGWVANVLHVLSLPAVVPSLQLTGWFAKGGFPEDGLFMANHGELVGQFNNGRTAVANNEQIIAGIERGVYNAMTSALANQNGGDRDIRVFLDGKEIGAASRRYERSMNRVTGVALG